MKGNGYLTFVLIAILVLTLCAVSATSIGTFKQSEDIELYQTCNNCTYCNFTSIKYPNSTNILTNRETTKAGTYYSYKLAKSNLSVLGTYVYCYDCGNAAEKSTGCIDFNVNMTGEELTQSKATFYLGLLALLIFLFVVNVVAIPYLPSGDNTDEEGKLISVNQLKYLKPILIFTAYLFLMAIVYVGSNISFAYLGTVLFGKILFRIFQVMMLLAYPMVVVWVIFLLYSMFQDRTMKKYLERGWE
jgi:hypothetical protein